MWERERVLVWEIERVGVWERENDNGESERVIV